MNELVNRFTTKHSQDLFYLEKQNFMNLILIREETLYRVQKFLNSKYDKSKIDTKVIALKNYVKQVVDSDSLGQINTQPIGLDDTHFFNSRNAIGKINNHR